MIQPEDSGDLDSKKHLSDNESCDYSGLSNDTQSEQDKRDIVRIPAKTKKIVGRVKPMTSPKQHSQDDEKMCSDKSGKNAESVASSGYVCALPSGCIVQTTRAKGEKLFYSDDSLKKIENASNVVRMDSDNRECEKFATSDDQLKTNKKDRSCCTLL